MKLESGFTLLVNKEDLLNGYYIIALTKNHEIRIRMINNSKTQITVWDNNDKIEFDYIVAIETINNIVEELRQLEELLREKIETISII